jgi:putative (di)nucleoside polyphosphate hydrolase
VCIGQKQKWFLLRLRCKESDVNLLKSNHPEFDDWRWVSYWYPIRNVVSFKRDVYRRVMKEFAPIVLPQGKAELTAKPSTNRPRRKHHRSSYNRSKAKARG